MVLVLFNFAWFYNSIIIIIIINDNEMMMMIIIIMIIVVVMIIITLFKEDNIFGTNVIQTYGPQLHVIDR